MSAVSDPHAAAELLTEVRHFFNTHYGFKSLAVGGENGHFNGNFGIAGGGGVRSESSGASPRRSRSDGAGGSTGDG